MKLYVECCESSKNPGKFYQCLKADFGYRVGVVTMDTAIICEMCDLTFAQVYGMKKGDKIPIALTVTK